MVFSIVDFVANALIEVVKRTGKRYVRMSVVDNYVEEVCHYADMHLLSEYDFVAAESEDLETYLNTFSIEEEDGDILVFLNQGCTISDLYKMFRMKLTQQWRKAFESEQGIKVLLTSGDC